jgi:hypothetical protein
MFWPVCGEIKKRVGKGIAGFLAMAAFVCVIPPVFSDSAPSAPALSPNIGSYYESLDEVYNGNDAPPGRKVQITSAVFNNNGYVLFDKAGETINVPLVKDNLYTMQFSRSAGRDMYFVNTGGQPTLYVPAGGYLIGVPPYYGPITGAYSADNAGGRWYPFTKGFSPADPVYMGPAPTWWAYLNMPWYPGLRIEGGYWSAKPVSSGVSVAPTPGLLFVIDAHQYRDWAEFMSYAILHPTPSRRFDDDDFGMGGGHGR